MAAPPSTTDSKASDCKAFAKLRPYIQKITVGNAAKREMFHNCLKASLAKCFEFNELVRADGGLGYAFFGIPALRGICEDLIVLNFVRKLPRKDRSQLLLELMAHDTHSRMDCQSKFFGRARPQQPVLSMKDAKTTIDSIETRIRAIWNRHGWPNLGHGTMPQIRQIAEKQGLPILSVLYDYLYRLTSGTVHFSVQSLLRSGWGNSLPECTFSTGHFQPYFLAFGRVYGAYLFCLYFEFFGRFLRPDASSKQAIDEIRTTLLSEPRWPEMVTFEEMNLKAPQLGVSNLLMTFMQARTTTKLIV